MVHDKKLGSKNNQKPIKVAAIHVKTTKHSSTRHEHQTFYQLIRGRSYRQHVLHVTAAVHRGCCGLLRHIVSGGQSRSWGVGSEKGTSEAGGEKRSEASPESEGAGSEFEGAQVPVPIYLVGPVEVRDMKEKGEDSNQSKGRSERSTGTASKEKKAKSHRRSSKLPVPTSAGEAGADGKTSKAKKRSGSSGRHRRKKDASSSKSSRTVGSTSDGGSKASKSDAKSKSDAGKVRSRKSGGGSKGRKGQKDGSRSRSRSASSGKSSKKDRKHATPQTSSKKDLSKKPVKL
uniref:Uncharacterized protein n=1 Tax=Meloidogyne javanica TaxID=6303 RepID=A0A915MV80_MELJA